MPFFLIDREETIYLPPANLNRVGQNNDLGKILKRDASVNIEGAMLPNIGPVICVTDIQDPEPLPLRPNDPYLPFSVKFKAVVFAPQPNEVVDVFVNTVSENMISCSIGSYKIAIASANIPNYSYSKTTIQQYVDKNTNDTIAPGDYIRVRIISRHDNFAVATLECQNNELGTVAARSNLL